MEPKEVRESQIVSPKGYTRKQFEEAFNRVCNKENWKMPIEAKLPKETTTEELSMISEAVIFYTGSVPKFRNVPETKEIVVEAAGYYATIGA